VVISFVSRLALIALVLQSVAAAALTVGLVDGDWQTAGNQSPAAPRNTSPPAPANTSPVAPVASVDPAAVVFAKSATAGLLLVTVKADKVPDYEEVIRVLQEALSKATDERRRALGQGWRVFKADADPKTNAIYIHLIEPVVPLADYRPSLLLDEILAGASAEMLAKYRDAIVGAPAMLGMNEFANLAKPPPDKPANASPDAPVPPKKPGA
jgi:hypothetical protein